MIDPSIRLLIVGDQALFDKTEAVLFDEGYDALYCADGAAALAYIREHGLPHLLIVGLELPDMSGFELCREVHTMADVPIITLTDQDAPGRAARALQTADDYLRKPVASDELAMRIRRILSRVTDFGYASGPRVEVCEGLSVDYTSRCAIVDGEVRSLTPTESILLHVLLKHVGQVVTAETLIERVWQGGIGIPDRNALRVHVHRLRNKIEPDPQVPSLILTERGIGYVFAGCVGK